MANDHNDTQRVFWYGRRDFQKALGSTVAEWSKALLVGKTKRKPKDLPGQSLKNSLKVVYLPNLFPGHKNELA